MTDRQRQLQRDTALLRTVTLTALTTALLVAGGMYGWHLSVVGTAAEDPATLDELQATVQGLQERVSDLSPTGAIATSTYQAVLATLPLGVRCTYLNVATLTEPAYVLQRPLLAGTEERTLRAFEDALTATSLPDGLRLDRLCTNGTDYGFTAVINGETPRQAFGAWHPARETVAFTETAPSADTPYQPAGFITLPDHQAALVLTAERNGEPVVAAFNAVTGNLQLLELAL